MTGRELVLQTLEFRNTDERVPRQLWTLPWATERYPETCRILESRYPGDIVTAPAIYAVPPLTQGDPFQIGTYVDEWGCRFQNASAGVIGEVKDPIIREDDWSDAAQVHIPEELATFDTERVNAFCADTDAFVQAGFCPRPFEQLQFLRGTENLYMDLMDPPPGMLDFMDKMHDFYCRVLTRWAQTDVDSLFIMDDWGSQRNLLINPDLWVEYFKPMYRDYIRIGKHYGKKVFMHSDGYILPIYPHLIEMGLDAINSQIFCMGTEALRRYRGQITFWGEIDRQHILSRGTREDVRRAVESVYRDLWSDGGCVAQFEFGPGADPDNALAVFESWESVRG